MHPFARPAAPAESFVSIVRGEGARVWDAGGKEYVDALASLWYCQVGHGRDEIVDAMARQARQIAAFHTFDRFTNEPAEELTERLVSIAPMPDARCFLTTGGSEAVDSALKLARLAHHVAGEPERTVIVSRAPSYHGVTFGGLAATGLPLNRAGFGPMVGDVEQVTHDDLDELDAVIERVGPDRVAALIAEPVIGAGGVLPPAPRYLAGLRERADRTGAFLILDEVICGFGRLGRWWGAERYDVVPDLVTFAKGVTSGYQPVGGVLVGSSVRERLEADESLILRHGHTYSGHPTACAAAVANLAIIEGEALADRAEAIGKALQQALEATGLGVVRGEGAVWALGLEDGGGALALRDRLLERGVIARPLGDTALAFCPPLVITDDELDRIADALKKG